MCPRVKSHPQFRFPLRNAAVKPMDALAFVRSATLEKECSATGATAACCDAVDSLPPAVWDPLHYKGDHATIRFLFHLVQVREFS